MGDLTRAMGIIQNVARSGGVLTVNHLVAAFEDVRAEEREGCAAICDGNGNITSALHIRQRRSIGAAVETREPPKQCPACDGRGGRASDEPYMQMAIEPCAACDGTGKASTSLPGGKDHG